MLCVSTFFVSLPKSFAATPARPCEAIAMRSQPRASAVSRIPFQACSLSMDLLRLNPSDLDPLVDGVEGVTAFYLNAGGGQVVFI